MTSCAFFCFWYGKTMDKEFLIPEGNKVPESQRGVLILFTEKIYQITLLFPKKEPLRYKMRETATAIFEDFVGLTFSHDFKSAGVELLVSLEVLDGFFQVAKKQSWANESDILAIQQEYANFKARIKQGDFGETDTKDQQLRFPEVSEISEFPESGDLNRLTGFAPEVMTAGFDGEIIKEKVNSRQRTILDFLKENGRAQVWQVKEILPDISKRTLRRDFEYMLKEGIINRIGQRNDTFYQLKTIEF